MNLVSKDVAMKFCETCDWVYESWVTHKSLFDENHGRKEVFKKVADFTVRLSRITQEYCLLQISKLHDPAIQRNSSNLTIDYVMKYGDWGSGKEQMELMKNQLSELWGRISLARNKILAHNDFKTIVNNTTLGIFPQGLDDKYFKVLQEFVNKVHIKYQGTIYPFNDLAKADVAIFLEIVKRGNNKKQSYKT